MKPRHREESAFVSRRDALRLALGAMGCASLAPLHRGMAMTPPAGAPATQRFLVVLELDGGNDGLNTVVPQGIPLYAQRRPTLALGSASTEALDSGPYATTAFRLHGRMPNLAALYRQGELAILNKVGYPRPNQSHDTSKQIWAAGRRDGLKTSNGWIARYADLAALDALGAIAVRRGRHIALVGGDSNPLMLDSLANFRFETDSSFTANHTHRLQLIRQMLAATPASPSRDALQTGHDLADQLAAAVSGYSSSANYGSSGIGGAMRDIARMLQAGFPTRIFYTGFGGFDTHSNQGTTAGQQGNLLGALDEALHAFATDCRTMGIWQQCVVVVISEFGRCNFENGSGGTDHGGANCVLVAGGAIQGGLHGEAPSEEDLSRSILPHAVDFRALYANLLQGHLGLANAQQRVFGGTIPSPVPVAVV
jgi:uncharacterized protein (DUF1501 family)